MSNKYRLERRKIIFKLFVLGLLAAVSWEDWNTKRIPDKYVLGMLGAGFVSMIVIPELSMMERMLGFFGISMPLLLIAGMMPGSVGGGDIKMMAAGGFLLGIRGIWQAFVTGVMSAGVYSVILMIHRKADRKTEIALGPFLSIGMILELLKS